MKALNVMTSSQWRKDYHQLNVAKILLSHMHEGIVSCDDPPLFSLDIGRLVPQGIEPLNSHSSSRANDDPPLFSLDNGRLVPQGIEPLNSHSVIQSFCQLNEPRMWPRFC